jgi:hypothetical protein
MTTHLRTFVSLTWNGLAPSCLASSWPGQHSSITAGGLIDDDYVLAHQHRSSRRDAPITVDGLDPEFVAPLWRVMNHPVPLSELRDQNRRWK